MAYITFWSVLNESNRHSTPLDSDKSKYVSIGVRFYVSTNEYSRADYREMHGITLTDRHAYEDDLELQFTYKTVELRKDRIWVHENMDEIIQYICAV